MPTLDPDPAAWKLDRSARSRPRRSSSFSLRSPSVSLESLSVGIILTGHEDAHFSSLSSLSWRATVRLICSFALSIFLCNARQRRNVLTETKEPRRTDLTSLQLSTKEQNLVHELTILELGRDAIQLGAQPGPCNGAGTAWSPS